MKRHAILVLTFAAGVGLLVNAGCEDAGARERADVQQGFTDAVADYNAARHAAPDDMVSQLQAVAGRLGRLRGEGGQSQAIALLQASIQRDLAEHWLSEASSIERQHRAARAAMIDVVDVAHRLTAMADTHRDLDFSRTQQQLQVQEQDRRAQHDNIASEVRDLERPINALQAEIDEAEARINELRRQEREAIMRANDLGPADGFEHFERGIGFRRQADDLEVEAARREIELATIEQDHERAARRAALQDTLALTLTEAQGRMISIRGDLQQEGRLTRDVAEELGQRIGEVLAVIRTDTSEPDGRLAALYAQASDALDESASPIRAAGSGEAVRTLGARIDQLRGQLHAQKAAALADHALLLNRMAAAGDLFGGGAGVRSERQRTLEAREAALAAAVEAYGDAATAFSAGRDGEQTAASLQAIADQLDNEPLDPATVEVTVVRDPATGMDMPGGMPGDGPDFDPEVFDFDMPAGMPGGMGDAEPWPLGDGADSPEALRDALFAAADGGPGAVLDAVRQYMNMNDIPEPLFVFGDMLVGIVESIDQLHGAIKQQFGDEGVDRLMGSFAEGAGAVNVQGGDTLLPGDLRVGPVEGDRGSLLFTDPETGQDESLPLVRIDGRWYFTLPDEMVAEMGAEINEAEVMQAAMMAQMFVGQIRATIDTFTSRVRAGEFNSVDELAQAIEATIQEALGGMMGPMGGGFEGDGQMPPGFPQ